MNKMEEFLNFSAVIKIRRGYDDDLFKFIQLMRETGFLKKYADFFEKYCCFDKEFNEFSEDTFWHYVKTNNGNTQDTCIEFQWGKGFTWGNRKDYLHYNNDIKILNIDELIRDCNKEELFNMNYEYTNFENELQDKESASDLDNFLKFYEWSIIKYPNQKYNIKDKECNTFVFEENTTLDKVIDRVYFRMFDYYIYEEDIDNLIQDYGFEYVKKTYESYMKIGESLKLLDEGIKKSYKDWFQQLMQENKEKDIDSKISNEKTSKKECHIVYDYE